MGTTIDAVFEEESAAEAGDGLLVGVEVLLVLDVTELLLVVFEEVGVEVEVVVDEVLLVEDVEVEVSVVLVLVDVVDVLVLVLVVEVVLLDVGPVSP